MLIAVSYYTFGSGLVVSGFIVSLSANSSFRTMELFSPGLVAVIVVLCLSSRYRVEKVAKLS